jgi:hypothetical protein
MKGSSLTHVAGGDAPLPPLHVPYGAPKPKQVGLDWSSMRPRFEDDAAPTARVRRCHVCAAPADSPDPGRCQQHYDEVREADPYRQHDTTIQTSTTEVPMPELVTSTEGAPTVVTTYVRDAALVLSTTEGHPDKLVRDLRKLAVQAIQALATAAGPTNAPASTSRAATLPPTPYTSSPKVEAGVPAAEIRLWAKSEGLDCPKFGRVPDSIKEAYVRAHEAGAA